MLARQRLLVSSVCIETRPYAGIRADRPCGAHARKDARDALNQVAHLFARGPHIVEVAVIVVVRRSEDAYVLPRLDENLSAVDCLGEDAVVAETPVYNDVDAFAGANTNA